MLIKFEADESLVAQVKALTGQAVGSKAFHAAASEALSMLEQIMQLKQQVADLRATVQTQRRVIEAARSSAAQLLEVAGQADIFSS